MSDDVTIDESLVIGVSEVSLTPEPARFIPSSSTDGRFLLSPRIMRNVEGTGRRKRGKEHGKNEREKEKGKEK
jgi:hypothetical protein